MDENLRKTHNLLKIVLAPMFTDMQWFVMIANVYVAFVYNREFNSQCQKESEYIMRRNKIIRIMEKNYIPWI